MMLRSAIIAGVGALLLTSCGGPDLGNCDRTKLGGGMSMPYDGQVTLKASCDGGRCHSTSATGKTREGAPAGLDFDVVPNTTSDQDVTRARHAFGVVSNHVEDIWEQIDDGDMPPPPPAGPGPLKATDKEVIRNWLACGAPVVEAPQMAAANADEWTKIFTQIFPQCQGCHSSTTSAAGGGFALGDTGNACGAYKNVHDVAAKSGGACAGRVLVKSGDPANSVLVQKLTVMNVCGSPMPLGTATAAMPFSSTNAALVAELQAWIMSGAPAPANCN